MKFQVKTTALAILVSLGVVGCKSNDTPNQVVEPTPANQASKTDAEKKAEADAKAKATAEAKAKAEAEAKAKAEEAKRLEEERKKAEAEAKKLTDAKAKAEAEAKAKAEAEAKRKAEEAKRLEEERKKAEEEAKRLAEEKAKADAEAKRKAEEAKKLAEEKAKADTEAKRKAEEAKKLAEEKAKADTEAKRKAEEAKKLAEEKAKADAEAKRKAEEAKRLEEERKRKEAEAAEKLKPVNLVDKNGVEWRIINIRERGPRNNTTEYLYGGYLDSLQSDFFPGKPKSFFDENGVNAETELNFNELSEKDGKPFLGVHQGKKEDKDFNGKIITKVLVEGNNIRVAETIDAKEFNYLYVNQPYSTYGALFTNGHDVKFFSVAKKAGIEDSDMFEYPVYEYEYVERNGKSIKTGKIIWNDTVAGEATYKGQVIASIVRATLNGDSSGIRQAPEIDGTVTLNARFDKDPERSVVSGEISSKQVGKIILEKGNISKASNISGLGKAINEKLGVDNKYSNGGLGKGSYSVNFYGKDLNDAVGRVDLRQYSGNAEKGEISQYNAIFGATKQPK